MAIGTTMAAILAVTAAVGATAYSSSQQNKQQKKFLSAMGQTPMPETPKTEEAVVSAEAKTQEKRRALARSRSVYSSPLGLAGQAQTIKKTLLGQ